MHPPKIDKRWNRNSAYVRARPMTIYFEVVDDPKRDVCAI